MSALSVEVAALPGGAACTTGLKSRPRTGDVARTAAGELPVHALFGNLWRYLNPWVGPSRLLGLRKALLPYRLGYWPAILGMLGFAWFELIYPAPDDPAILAQAVIVYSIVTWVGMALFGEQAPVRADVELRVDFLGEEADDAEAALGERSERDRHRDERAG